VSSREVRREDFVQNIQNTLRETGMRPFCMELEITESILVDDFARVLRMLKVLHDQGVRIAIDDFGTGYSSLAYLRQLPFDVLKIDRAFVNEIGVGDSSDAICSSIVGMAHALGKEVVAEGVETEAQRLFLTQIGCEIGQGYLWSPPTSAQDFAQLVRGWTAAPQPELLSSAGRGVR
jgi:EAL domain-containing protein (putative c-di-GMP-specific phosphodiesterase class I)